MKAISSQWSVVSKTAFFFALCAVLFALWPVGESQPSSVGIPRIGFLSGSGFPSNPPMSEKAFRQGLSDLGYVDGKNMVLEVRYAQGNRARIPSLVAELMQVKVDVFLTAKSNRYPPGQADNSDDPDRHGYKCGSGCDRTGR